MTPRLRLLLFAILLLPGSLSAADDFDTCLSKGNAFDQLGQTDRALICYQEAEKLQPKNADLLCLMAKQYLDALADTDSREKKRSLSQSALAYSERAIALEPEHSMAQTLVAISYARLGKFSDTRSKVAYSQKIEAHARKALLIKPDNDLANYVLGVWNFEVASISPLQRRLAKWAYGGIPSASLSDAELYIKKAIALNPARPAYLVELGRVYAAMGKKAEAKAALEKAVTMPNPGKSDPRMKERAQKALKKL